jgi:hypothetical protein
MTFGELLQSLFATILSIENITLEALDTMVPLENHDPRDMFNVEFYHLLNFLSELPVY